jgi:hypothetical protein
MHTCTHAQVEKVNIGHLYELHLQARDALLDPECGTKVDLMYYTAQDKEEDFKRITARCNDQDTKKNLKLILKELVAAHKNKRKGTGRVHVSEFLTGALKGVNGIRRSAFCCRQNTSMKTYFAAAATPR